MGRLPGAPVLLRQVQAVCQHPETSSSPPSSCPGSEQKLRLFKMRVFKNPAALTDGIKKRSGSLSLPNLGNYFDTKIDPPCEIELGDIY